ncbi:hypothetical protein TIFTF001_018261 [Ficus carica]|uniref:Anther-specific protein BCP1 n=1 Tax=Ficus carica TaxID=3494 RepID=A0AA88AAR4_FICCA|nr:hypothetical protein TIFTF001_018261 [Ficus carica]
MARPAAVVLALLLVAVAVSGRLASAQTTPNADSSAVAEALPALGPASDDVIGNSDEVDDLAKVEDDVVEAPVGGPAPPGVFPPSAEAPQNSGATAVDFSAFAGVAVAAVAGYFF